jgi:hypothetical protein
MSFLIYTESFDSLPPYRQLAPTDRHAVLKILQATKPDFARALALDSGP